MDAVLTTTRRDGPAEGQITRLLRAASCGLVALVWLVALVFLASRLAGGLQTAASASALLAVAVGLASLAACGRRLWPRSVGSATSPQATVWIDWLPLPAMLLAGCAMAMPGATGIGTAGYFTIVLIAEGWALRRYRPAYRRKLAGVVQPVLPTATVASESPPSLPADQIRIDPPQTPAPHFPTEDVAQQLVRRVDAHGNDVAEGWVRAVFEPRQRTASVHVAFCPTLEGELSLECEQVDGAEARVKAAQLLPYGVRFDVKLADAAKRAESVLIEFAAKGDAALARTMSAG